MRRRFLFGVFAGTCGSGNLIYKRKHTEGCLYVGKRHRSDCGMYRQVLESDIMEVSSPAVAEMEKILKIRTEISISLLSTNWQCSATKWTSIFGKSLRRQRQSPMDFRLYRNKADTAFRSIRIIVLESEKIDFHISLLEASAMCNDKMPSIVWRSGQDFESPQKP